ncbi:nucleic acid-binding protein [Aaosphaeria arxii CBS 175.79]|uniref:Nucleic acid-binding protein n=1 Tax=Aaosphaeria arxii CBS 175.79 TaxID=1450172 RepID=A0A6A5XAX6_9PLEO|nr:nucleic acid-binding protein [Aaosphaeria arxii CBS 175.79]KAF2010060.1 nucleic acid-binding protein [Aaosphaeria arxii CBS 175.79]
MPRPKRNILATVQDTLTPPDELSESQAIARVSKAAGKNLYIAELPGGKSILVELVAKFRSTIWIKRGGYVVVDVKALADRENKLDGEIVNVVREEKEWRKMSYWPKEFEKKQTYVDSDEEESTVGKMPPSDSEED